MLVVGPGGGRYNGSDRASAAVAWIEGWAAMIIIGWRQVFTILGIKWDECALCGQTCQHVVGRKVRWGTVFFIPVLFLGFAHGMACTGCHAWTGIPFLRVREALRSGQLPLAQARPHAQQVLAEAATEGQPPLNATAVYDQLSLNPDRGGWDRYLRVYPFLAVAMVAVMAVSTALQPPPPAAHGCWMATDGAIIGCRLTSGEVVGTSDGNAVTCWFREPLTEETSLRCDH